MGCCSSKADADQPKKTIIIQQAEPVQHIIPIDNPTTSIINERQRIQIEEEDRARREALERAESKRRGAPIKTPPKSKHAKLLALVDDKYKNLQSLLILLHENLKKNDKEDKELATLNQGIKSDSKEIEGAIDDLQAQSFPNDKEYVKDLRKIVLVSKNLDLEYQSLKKKNKKYPEYKKTILGTLNDQYAELFDESKTQGSMRRPEFSASPNSELRTISERKTSPSRNFHDGSLSRDETYMVRAGEPGLMPQHVLTVTYDDPFDREMANVVQKQKDDVAFELDTAVHEYERLQMDFNVLKARQEVLNKDYRAAQQEIKELHDANKQISTRNNAMGAENGSFKENKTEVLRKHEHTKQACAALESELAELRALYIQRVAEGDLIEQEHEFRVSQLEYEIKRKQEEAREIEKNRKEEELKLREEERRCVDDERRREEHERKRREVERKRQDDERRHLEEDKMRKEELRRVEARIAEVDRQRRSQMLEQLNPVVDFSTSVPLAREVRTSIPIAQTVSIGMPTMLPPLHPDSREAERKLQEDIRRIQMMNEEADRKRAHMIQQLSMPVTVEVPPPNMPIVSNPVLYSSPVRFEDIVLPTKYTSMQLEPPVVSPFVVLPVEAPAANFIVQEPVIVNEGRRSIYVDHDRPREFPRRSATVERPQPRFVDEGMKKRAVDDHMQGRRTEGVSSALDMARKARMGMDRSQVAAAMDNKRLEAQNVPINYQSGFGY